MSHKTAGVAHLRVFFDKRSGKAERIEQFIAERGIEYGLQIVTRFFFNSPECLYTKKACKFLQSYEKSSEKPNLFEFFRGEDKSLADKLIEWHQKAIGKSKEKYFFLWFFARFALPLQAK